MDVGKLSRGLADVIENHCPIRNVCSISASDIEIEQRYTPLVIDHPHPQFGVGVGVVFQAVIVDKSGSTCKYGEDDGCESGFRMCSYSLFVHEAPVLSQKGGGIDRRKRVVEMHEVSSDL